MGQHTSRRTQDDRVDHGLPLVVPLHRSRHLAIVAVFGGQEIGTDEQQHDVGTEEFFAYSVVQPLTDEGRRSGQVLMIPV